jgi:hypothetical protein
MSIFLINQAMIKEIPKNACGLQLWSSKHSFLCSGDTVTSPSSSNFGKFGLKQSQAGKKLHKNTNMMNKWGKNMNQCARPLCQKRKIQAMLISQASIRSVLCPS